MKTKPGFLYGIGVGPGDSELMTIKAAKILSQVDTVFAAASSKNNHSLAVNIAREYIPDSVKIQMLRFPMTKDNNKTRQAWRKNAQTIVDELEQGKKGAFLTLGDAMTYSTFGYIVKQIQSIAPYIDIRTVPGITSYQAAAARLNTPLVEGEESLMIVSGVTGGDRLRKLSGPPENVVFLKAYRNVKDIRAAIDEIGYYPSCVGVKNCSHPNEEIIPTMEELGKCIPDYWTLIIAKRNGSNDSSKE